MLFTQLPTPDRLHAFTRMRLLLPSAVALTALCCHAQSDYVTLNVSDATNVGAAGVVTDALWFLNLPIQGAYPVTVTGLVLNLWNSDSCFASSSTVTIRANFHSMSSCEPTSDCNASTPLWSSGTDTVINVGASPMPEPGTTASRMLEPNVVLSGPARLTIINRNRVCNMKVNGSVARVFYTAGFAASTATTTPLAIPPAVATSDSPKPSVGALMTTEVSQAPPGADSAASPSPLIRFFSPSSTQDWIVIGSAALGVYVLLAILFGATLHCCVVGDVSPNISDAHCQQPREPKSCGCGETMLVLYYLFFYIPASLIYMIVAIAVVLALCLVIGIVQTIVSLCPGADAAFDQCCSCLTPGGGGGDCCSCGTRSVALLIIFAPWRTPLHMAATGILCGSCCGVATTRQVVQSQPIFVSPYPQCGAATGHQTSCHQTSCHPSPLKR